MLLSRPRVHSQTCSLLKPNLRSLSHHRTTGWLPDRGVLALQHRSSRSSKRSHIKSGSLLCAALRGDFNDSYDVVIVGAGIKLYIARSLSLNSSTNEAQLREYPISLWNKHLTGKS